MGLGAVVRLMAPPARRANRDKKETVSPREQADSDAAERKRKGGQGPRLVFAQSEELYAVAEGANRDKKKR